MSATILDGRKTREALVPELIKKVQSIFPAPVLAIIQVGDRADSTAYITGKKAFAEKIGVAVKYIHLKEKATQAEVLKAVQECNADASVRGVIVQLPLPLSIDSDTVINSIDPKKDVDGLTPLNVRGWSEGREDAILPATTRGILELFRFHKISLSGKHVVVVGRSSMVGKPTAAMCVNEGATVTVCHSKTGDLAAETKKADIVIVAVGKPGLITAKHVHKKQIIIDVGITSVGGKLVGDVDFDAVKDIVTMITPVPGGVGPMTVLGIFENMVDLCKK